MISPVKVWRNQKKLQTRVEKIGMIKSFTIVRVPPARWKESAPYPVVIVEFEDKKRMTCKMVDYQDKHVHVGQKVITVVRRIRKPSREGVIPYGIKVKPIDE